MGKIVLNITILAALFLLLFAVAQLLYYRLKLRVNNTRRIVHTGTGILTLLFPLLLANQWQVLFLCTLFAVILTVSKKRNWLQSIHSIERFSYGSILYPVAVYSCYLVYEHFDKTLLLFYLPVLILAICDPIAALIGSRFPYGVFYIGKDKKTVSGSLAFFISCLFVSFILFAFLSEDHITHELPFIALMALVSAGVEALSIKGFDNITIPAAVLLLLIASR